MLQSPVQLPIQDPLKRHHHFNSSSFRRPNDLQPLNRPFFDHDSSSAALKLSMPPRSPYISSRHPILPSPPLSAQALSPAVSVHKPLSSKSGSRPSSIVSSTAEDVLVPGDIVGNGCTLQGEPIRLVSFGQSSPASIVEDIATEFQVVKRLGTGSYAVVYLVREVLARTPGSEDGHMPMLGHMDIDGRPASRSSITYGREFAIKCLSKANLDDDALAAQLTEVTIHQSLQAHPNIVTLHRTLETSSFLLLVLEYVPGEDLFYFLEQARDHYESDSPIDPSVSPSRTPPTPSLLSSMDPTQLLSRTRLRLISSMFCQMCDAVAACHQQQVFHRDIKPENFIVTDGFVQLPNGRAERKVVVKLSDFGLSTTDLESSDMDCGSAPYMSYECRNNIAPTYKPRAADVWSLGIVLINMLYHINPWTDTSQDSCSSFDAFRRQPVNFFLTRFTGMTRPVAEFIANRVFCILEDPSDDSQRVSAAEFGAWARDLPALLGAPLPSGLHSRSGSFSGSSIQGFSISSSAQISHRPCSRPQSRCSSALGMRTPLGGTMRSLSRAPSLGPALEREELRELSTVFDHEVDSIPEGAVADSPQDFADLDFDGEGDVISGMESRSTSTNKRRKRGARNRKGLAQSHTPTTPNDFTLATLAVASQSLARELSMTSKASSARTAGSGTSSRRPFEPVAMYPIPTPLLSSSAQPLPPPLPTSAPSSAASTPMLAPAKKPSKWKLSFGKASASSLASAASGTPTVSPVIDTMSTSDLHSLRTMSSMGSMGHFGSRETLPPSMSATASNVTNLLMGLSAPPPAPSALAMKSNDDLTSWSRGRRGRVTPAASSVNVNISALNGQREGGSRSRGPSLHPLSSSPHRDREREHRGISPNSTRSGRALTSSASSMASGNWRNSMSTTSSAGTSTSAFTRYSNSSARSISTMATSVSSNSTSWRNTQKGPTSPRPSAMPKNIKFMDGVPWELDQLPRGLHPNPVGDIFGSPPVRKQRTRKPKDPQLDTINERPPAQRSPEYLRRDASTSTTDLTSQNKQDLDNPKKMPKAQITSFGKMLSALRR
ncbi:hypothetical protein HGRIS_002311 [Hohenbuehelia grisea]|uniref:Protein kinase domain-containing protein n=1 Tax=Hohenbuehelia grisea TaxID=104357 RepID=A0ABR3JK44_9AGAR